VLGSEKKNLIVRLHRQFRGALSNTTEDFHCGAVRVSEKDPPTNLSRDFIGSGLASPVGAEHRNKRATQSEKITLYGRLK
jgi:hypothetical protein